MTEIDPDALKAGQRAAMASNGCGYKNAAGEHVHCDDASLPDHVRDDNCSCKQDAEAAIRAYFAAAATRTLERPKSVFEQLDVTFTREEWAAFNARAGTNYPYPFADVVSLRGPGSA